MMESSSSSSSFASAAAAAVGQVVVILHVDRCKWIHGRSVVLEGTTTTRTTAKNHDDWMSNDTSSSSSSSSSIVTTLAPADKACLVTISSSPGKNKTRRNQGHSKVDDKDDMVAQLRQAATALQPSVAGLATSAKVDNQPGNWMYMEEEDNGQRPSLLCLAVTCQPTTERNRRGTRRVQCSKFLHLWWQTSEEMPQQGTTTVPTTSTFTNTYPSTIMNGNNNNNNNNNNNQQQQQYPTTSVFGLYHKDYRHELFADWIGQTYGTQQPAVLDVAGGNGQLARALIRRGIAQRVVLLDPKPRLYVQKQDYNDDDDDDKDSNDVQQQRRRQQQQQAVMDERITLLARPLVGDGSDLLACPTAGPLIRQCTLVCGMHPDHATEAIIDLAQQQQQQFMTRTTTHVVPFALLPCCVMPSLFPTRQKPNGEPVRSYTTFCDYLRRKKLSSSGDSENESMYREAYLPFDGRNKIIYSLPKPHYCVNASTGTTKQDCHLT